ncbi:MAG: NAD(P)-dependent oxidoreductase [Gemmatimonadetes bacterium]|nr:NAD(P)-dependent oxidoreductase [Gemmatimonadota bacterium]
MRVGMIGLGFMGSGMAANLLKGGIDLTVNDILPEKVERAVSLGARAAGSVGALVERVDVVLASLPSVEVCRQVFLGPGGVIEHARAGQVLVDHSTVDLVASRECAEAAAAKGAGFLDAPVSGGPKGAEEGTLSIMVGGERAAFETARPVFDLMGTNVRHMGGSGSGTAMKLMNQLLVSVHTCAAAEAFLLAERAGLDVQTAADVLHVSWGGSTILERNAPIVKRREFAGSGAPVRLFVKDLGILTKLGRDLGIALPMSNLAQELINETSETFGDDYDVSAPFLVLEKRSGG